MKKSDFITVLPVFAMFTIVFSYIIPISSNSIMNIAISAGINVALASLAYFMVRMLKKLERKKEEK